MALRGKAGPRPLTAEERATTVNTPADTEVKTVTVIIRCAGCDSTEVKWKDDQGFFYCDLHPSSAHSNALVTKLEDEQIAEINKQNAAAGVALTPTVEQQQRIDAADKAKEEEQPREAVGNTPISVPKFPRPTTKVLPIKLGEGELNGYRSRLADHVDEMIQAEKEKKEMTAPINERIKEARKEINNINMVIRNSVRHDLVNCEWRPNWTDNSKELWRLDTNEIVDRQPLDFEDRQLELREAEEKNNNSGTSVGTEEQTETQPPEPAPTVN